MTHRPRFDEWQENRSWLLGPAAKQIAVYLQSFKDFPPRQASMDLNIDEMVHQLNTAPNR